MAQLSRIAAAGLWSNPTDLAKVMLMIQRAYANSKKEFLSPSIVRQMLKVQKAPSGLGLMLKKTPTTLVFEHLGVNHGFVSVWHGLIDLSGKKAGQGVVVMTNSSTGSGLIEEIVAAVADIYSWPHRKLIEKF